MEKQKAVWGGIAVVAILALAFFLRRGVEEEPRVTHKATEEESETLFVG